MSENINVRFSVNGEEVIYNIAPHTNLLRALRNNYVYDVKCGCEEGDCGTCTVLLDGVPVKSCVTLAAACEGHEVWTNKGLGYNDRITARLQRAFVERGSVQCGFCIPGMVLATYVLLSNNPDPTEEEIRVGISGNICRCTGYDLIVESIRLAAKKGAALWKK